MLGRRLPSNTRESIFYLVSTRPGVWDLSLKSRLNMPKVSRLDFLYMKYTVQKSLLKHDECVLTWIT